MTLRLPCVIVESPRRHKRVLIVNIAFLRSQSIKRHQWKHKFDYYGVVFAHLAAGCGLKWKTPRGWIQIGESRTRGVARIPLGLKPLRDSRATSQLDSPIWIQPLGVFRYIMQLPICDHCMRPFLLHTYSAIPSLSHSPYSRVLSCIPPRTYNLIEGADDICRESFCRSHILYW